MAGYRDINGAALWPIALVRHGRHGQLLTRGELVGVAGTTVTLRVDRSEWMTFDLTTADITIEETP